ncbi:MAG: hypothetical protein Pg6C_15550 [Treponemataceae bacterium]|nr:MAG: hypothetical protein Pg6C_15550 [Treponemataceae bacterium]
MDNRQCACCGQKTLNPALKFHGICPVCGWEDDPIQNDDPSYEGGANTINLITARQAFAEGKDMRQLIEETHQRLIKHLEEDSVTDEPVTVASLAGADAR